MELNRRRQIVIRPHNDQKHLAVVEYRTYRRGADDIGELVDDTVCYRNHSDIFGAIEEFLDPPERYKHKPGHISLRFILDDRAGWVLNYFNHYKTIGKARAAVLNWAKGRPIVVGMDQTSVITVSTKFNWRVEVVIVGGAKIKDLVPKGTILGGKSNE